MAAKTGRKSKHIPQRTCIGCREVLSKRQLIRLVRTGEGIVVDPTGKLAGRGAYLHNQKSCWQSALKGALAHALKTELTEQDKQKLRAYLDSFPEETGEDEKAGGTPEKSGDLGNAPMTV